METILAPSQVTEGCCMWGFGFCLCAVGISEWLMFLQYGPFHSSFRMMAHAPWMAFFFGNP